MFILGFVQKVMYSIQNINNQMNIVFIEKKNIQLNGWSKRFISFQRFDKAFNDLIYCLCSFMLCTVNFKIDTNKSNC